MVDIFQRVPLTANTLRMVALRRLGDAEYLIGSGQNRYANGAMYLAGFTLECLLKARLLEKRPELGRHRDDDEEHSSLRRLLFSHDLGALLGSIPNFHEDLLRVLRDPDRVHATIRQLQLISDRWSVFARYSPSQETMKPAVEFVREVKGMTRIFDAVRANP